MKMRLTLRPAMVTALASLLVSGSGRPACPQTQQPPAAPLRLVQTIPLPDVEGRIDHLAVDVKRGQLFVAALGNNTVEVVDLNVGKRSATLTGLKEPQGIAVDPATGRIFVANGQGGDVRLFDGASLHLLETVPLGDDADNVRFDIASGRTYVGYGGGALAVLKGGNVLSRIRLTGHPESFQLEKQGSRLFVNVPDAGHIAVVDRKSEKVVATWPMTEARANFPMALDEAEHRLFVGCRSPAALLVFDTETGKPVARAGIAGDTDDVFWDEKRRQIYVSCGEGFLDVERGQGDRYERVAHLPTAAGARTSLFVPELSRLYLAVPHRGGQGAEIRVYAAQEAPK
jgi:DNA-binding beta-propeller fold protein YncE